MMRVNNQTTFGMPHTNISSVESMRAEWEMRPGGMLVQKRTDSDQYPVPPPTIRVRVKYGSIYHEINISSQATFGTKLLMIIWCFIYGATGELKKMLVGPTGLHHQDQKLMYKDKERDSKAFLDTVGVKDKSKIVLVEDPISQEKRFLEMRRSAKMEKASKSISEISLEIDRFAGRVSALESIINKGGKVVETDLINLIELLMNQLLKLDGIMGDGDVKLQRKMQVRRVQKYVETLDILKVKNGNPTSNEIQNPNKVEEKHSGGQQKASNGPKNMGVDEQQTSGTVVTTKWETFDFDTNPVLVSSSTSASSAINNSVQPKFNWDFL